MFIFQLARKQILSNPLPSERPPPAVSSQEFSNILANDHSRQLPLNMKALSVDFHRIETFVTIQANRGSLPRAAADREAANARRCFVPQRRLAEGFKNHPKNIEK